MLQAFLKELELGEDHCYAMSSKTPYKHDGNDDRVKGRTVNALFTKENNGDCDFCLGKCANENCLTIGHIPNITILTWL